jgi:hypothetical protein
MFSIILVGFLSIFTDLMILFALTMSKVSYVGDSRGINVRGSESAGMPPVRPRSYPAVASRLFF